MQTGNNVQESEKTNLLLQQWQTRKAVHYFPERSKIIISGKYEAEELNIILDLNKGENYLQATILPYIP